MSPAKHNCVDARSKAAVWTVDDVARLIEILKKEILFIHLFITFGSTWSDLEGWQKLDQLQNSPKLYLFIIAYKYSKHSWFSAIAFFTSEM